MQAGSVAVITGAAGALGSEVARALAKEGYRLALLDGERARDRLNTLAESLGGACVVVGYLTATATWDEALTRIARELGDAPAAAALIAGGWRGGKPLHESSDEIWSAMMSANLETVHRSLRALVPAMVARQRGSIVAIGSRAAVAPETSAGAAAYAASKAAAVALVQAVAAEVLMAGVRVNALLPSTLDTAANRAAMPKADPTKWVTLASAAAAVAFLLGEGARDISGAAIPLYGKA